MFYLICGSSNLGPVTRKHLGEIMKPTSFFEDGEAQARDQPFVQILLVSISYTSKHHMFGISINVFSISVCLLIISSTLVQDTASYDDADLVVWSMHLLNRFFSSESDVFENAVDTQVRLRVFS